MSSLYTRIVDGEEVICRNMMDESGFKYTQIKEQSSPWLFHSFDDQCSWEYDSDKIWHYKGLKHRIGAPAAFTDNNWHYYHMNKLHRLDGPAVFFYGVHSWYIMGNKIPFNVLKEMGIDDPMNIDPLDQELLKIKFSEPLEDEG